MAINIPLSTLCIRDGKVDEKVIKLVLDKIAQMGFINSYFDFDRLVFKAGYIHEKMNTLHHTNLIGISDNYVYVNPCIDHEGLINYLKSIRSIIREGVIDKIIYDT